MRRELCAISVLAVALGQPARGQELTVEDVLRGASYEAMERDRDTAIAVIRAARGKAQTGAAAGPDAKLFDFCGWFDQQAPMAAGDDAPGIEMLVPDLPISAETIARTADSLVMATNRRPELGEAFSPEGIFDIGIEAAKSGAGWQGDGITYPEDYGSFVRGVVVLNTQLDKQAASVGRTPGSEKYCWFPCCLD